MADDQSPISDIPNLTDAHNLQEVQDQFQRAEAARRAGATASRGTGATGGAGGNVTENPCGDLDGRMIAQMELQAIVGGHHGAHCGPGSSYNSPGTTSGNARGPGSSNGTKHPGVVPDHTGALLREVQGWEEHSAKRVPDGARSETNQTRLGAKYVAAFCQVLSEGRGCFMVGSLHLVIRG
jgi:hypothetical protein